MYERKRGMTDSTLSGLLWTFSGKGAYALLQVLLLIVLARVLTPEEFGVVGIALVVVRFSTVFSQLGVSQALIQRAELEATHLRTAFTLSVLLGTAVAGIVWIAAPSISSFFRMGELTAVVRCLALIFPLQGVSLVSESLLRRDLEFRRLSWVQGLSAGAAYGVVGVALALLEFGIWALVAAHLAQSVFRTGMLLYLRPCRMTPSIERKACGELLYFGGGLTGGRISNYFALQGDNLVVGRFLGAEALGIYGRAYQLVAAPAVVLGQALDNVMFPTMSRLRDEPERFAKVYCRCIALLSLMTLPVCAASFALAPELIDVLLGADWSDVVVPFEILALGMLFRAGSRLSDSMSRAAGAVYRNAWRQAAFAGLVMGGASIGQFWGLAGAAAAVLLAMAAHFLSMTQLSLKLASISWRSFAAAHVPGLALGGLVWAEIELVVSILRGWELSSAAVLFASLIAVVPTLVLVRCLPELFLGPDGRWMMQTLVNYAAARLPICFPSTTEPLKKRGLPEEEPRRIL